MLVYTYKNTRRLIQTGRYFTFQRSSHILLSLLSPDGTKLSFVVLTSSECHVTHTQNFTLFVTRCTSHAFFITMSNSPDSSVDIATRCVLEGPWIESLKGGRDMPLQSRRPLGQPSYDGY